MSYSFLVRIISDATNVVSRLEEDSHAHLAPDYNS